MITFEQAVSMIEPLQEEDLMMWIEQRWVVPAHQEEGYRFSDIDMARLHLICDIRYTFEVAPETVSLVLSLLDQVYASRRQMQKLADAIAAQPDAVREAIFDSLNPSDEAKPTP